MTFSAPHHATLTSLALAILSITSTSALAQTSDKNVDEVIVTATRSPQRASEVISDTLTINADQIAQSGAGSIIDLLQRQRGIEVSRNGGPGSSSSVFIRGANSNQNIVLVDGIRIGSATLGAANWSAIPLAAIDHIEVVYGPLSTLYGADAIGGVIQIFTKKGQGAPIFSALAGYGTNNTRELEASIAGSTGGDHNFSYAISAAKDKSDGFNATRPGNYSFNPDRDGYDKENVAAQFGLQLAKGHEIGLIFMHSRLDAQFDNGPSSFNAHSVQKLDNVGIYSKNQFLSNWTSLVQISQARDNSSTESSTDPVYGKSQIETKQTELTWQNDIRIGEYGDILQLLYGHRKEEVISNSTPELGRDRDTNSFAASYNMKRGAHLFNVSVRNDDSSQYGSKTTGAAGYGYRITDTLRATASYGTSFRAPSFNELYYPGYGIPTNKPEQGRNAEIGMHYNDGTTKLGVIYYHNRLSNLLVEANPCPVEPQTYTYGCAYNVNHALLQGVTLSASHQLGNFRLSGNIDLQNPQDETTGKLLARRAKKHANFGVDYGTGALKGGVEWDLSGSRFEDPSNNTRLGGYGLLNLYATYQITPDWSTLLRWNNIANKQYDLAQNYATPGSNVFVALRYGYK